MAAHGLVAPQYGMMFLLDLEGPMTQNELGAYVAVDKATMVRMIDGLEEKKWVLRVPSPKDRRANQLRLTPAGKQIIKRLDQLRKRAEEEFLAPLSETERAQLSVIVNKLVTSLL
jgi:DNA-binding MarR family transcriptional regulator